ncbi:unnamed protein product [Paramecium sonneborni]|uniref:S1-like domain-containing protein n=1 Tax=Paramecium sonneborni TaxID=65129 RepID=A0A8S1PZX6_9CILI|nr:unnamed protein product [Paramecium sonneborni]
MGSRRLIFLCLSDSKQRLGHIRGKIRRKVWIQMWILCLFNLKSLKMKNAMLSINTSQKKSNNQKISKEYQKYKIIYVVEVVHVQFILLGQNHRIQIQIQVIVILIQNQNNNKNNNHKNINPKEHKPLQKAIKKQLQQRFKIYFTNKYNSQNLQIYSNLKNLQLNTQFV